MNKRGDHTVLNALGIIVIALIVFIPSCMKASELFRISGQATENFAQIVAKMEKLNQEGRVGQIESDILILDKKTSIVFFKPQFPDVTISADGFNYFKRPSMCDLDKNCLCLFQDVKLEGLYFLSKKAICYHVPFSLEINTCTPLGYEKGEVSCQNGFFIAREIENFGKYRRIGLNLIKEADHLQVIQHE